jgi:hypothetical protein
MITRKQAEDVASAGEAVCKGLARGFRRYVEAQAENHERIQQRIDYEVTVRTDAVIDLVKMAQKVILGTKKGRPQ